MAFARHPLALIVKMLVYCNLIMAVPSNAVAQIPVAYNVGRKELAGLSLGVEVSYFSDYNSLHAADRGEVPQGTIFGEAGGFLRFTHTITVEDSDDGTSTPLWSKVDTYAIQYLLHTPEPREEAIFRVLDAATDSDRLYILGGIREGEELRTVEIGTTAETLTRLRILPPFHRSRVPLIELREGRVYALTQVEEAKDKWTTRFFTLEPGTREPLEVSSELAPEALRARVGKGRAFDHIPPYSEIVEQAIQKARALAEEEKLKE